MEHLINLNFAPGGLPATVHVSQYDDTIRQLRFQLWFGRSKVEVPSGASVRVDIKKPDGHIVLVNGTVNSSDRSIVTVPTTKQMTAAPGGARGTLVVSSTGDKRISSAIFILHVHRDPVEDGDASDSDLSMLQDAIDQTAANASAAQAAATAAQEAASSFTTDTTLSVSGKAADAKKTGDELTAIKADLGAQTGLFHWNERGLIDLSGSSVNLTPETNQGIDYAVIDCSAGDKFIITATGGNKSRVWGFIDENNAILTVSDANATVENFEITAPTNAVKLILNAYRNSDIYAYKVGNNLATKASNGLSDEVKEAILDCFRNVGWLDETDGKESFNALLEAFDMSNFYNTWEWSYPGELVMGKAAPSFLEGSQTDGILYNNNASSQKNRRFPVVNRGKLKCVEYEEVPGDIYPIPIPKDATSVTVTIAPATMYLFLIRWVIQGGVYKLAGSKLWTQGTSTLSFDAASNAFLSINIKYDSSSNTTFATEPQGLEITFE